MPAQMPNVDAQAEAPGAEELLKLKKSAVNGVIGVGVLPLLLIGALFYVIHLSGQRFNGVHLFLCCYWGAMTALSVVSLVGIQKRMKSLALICGAIPASLLCLMFPFGTLLGALCFVNLFNREFREHWFSIR